MAGDYLSAWPQLGQADGPRVNEAAQCGHVMMFSAAVWAIGASSGKGVGMRRSRSRWCADACASLATIASQHAPQIEPTPSVALVRLARPPSMQKMLATNASVAIVIMERAPFRIYANT